LKHVFAFAFGRFGLSAAQQSMNARDEFAHAKGLVT